LSALSAEKVKAVLGSEVSQVAPDFGSPTVSTFDVPPAFSLVASPMVKINCLSLTKGRVVLNDPLPFEYALEGMEMLRATSKY
jgi:hypothetical protein